MRADGPDDRQGEVTAVGFHTHRSGRERHSILVAAFAFETGKPDPFTGAFAGAGGLPVPVRLDRTRDAIGVGLF
ncbi:Uncharacterised protein [Mycobacterium tuberculosis]|uniref:Uncharacterized protein n=1 Tax=Mycobacterium tuberculosis TaxID=1773 RepID=A0A655FA68_MYCTX|nr:Uncharacterised protein [Mycobacterium tuberculosis]CKN31764.1 Uncharacterised protein [Mycobacterium tuberculosis]CKR28317.1 Uncharacterised protein [Mycobacterium tuberculosis]CKR37744.1 Uncharacterised protein [Mycobacterium tuberculosis]CKR55111.1 Uncharacterised protein [Mycobacterium tuberculosis]